MYFYNSMNGQPGVRKRRILNSDLCGKLGRGLYNYDFEDTRDQSWGAFPDKKKHKFNFSTNSAHSGIHSVKLDVDIEPYETNEDEEYGGIYNTNLNIHEAKAIKAWVLVPESEQVRGSNIKSHIMAYMMGSKGKAIWFFGEEKKIVPGVWTQIFLDVFFRTDSENCTVRWDETSDQVYVTVWSDKEYSGPIYFDNITIYGSS